MKHGLVEYSMIAIACGILLYVVYRRFRPSIQEGALFPSAKSMDLIAKTAGVSTQEDTRKSNEPTSMESNPLPPGQSASKETPKPVKKLMNVVAMIERLEKNPEELAKWIELVHDPVIQWFSSKEPNRERDDIYRTFDSLPNEYKPRVLKLASTDADFKRIIAKDVHFKPYAYRYLGSPESTDVPNYADSSQLPLKEYFVKASYNSVYDGTKGEPSITKLKEILYNGCRYIDLQVFSIEDPKTKESRLYVAYGEDDEIPTVDTTMPLSNVLTYINSHAFNKDGSMTTAMLKGDPDKSKRATLPSLLDNYIHYPLFLTFRIYRKSKESPDIVKMLYDDYLNPTNNGGLIDRQKLYLSEDGTKAIPVTGNTPLNKVQGKIVMCMDIDNILKAYTESFDPLDIPESTKTALRKYVNVKSGGHTWKTYHNYNTIESTVMTPLTHYTDGELSESYETNVKNWFLSLPNKSNLENPAALNHALNYKIQVSPCRYYISDANLGKYNEIFDYFKAPMIPMSQIINYKG